METPGQTRAQVAEKQARRLAEIPGDEARKVKSIEERVARGIFVRRGTLAWLEAYRKRQQQ